MMPSPAWRWVTPLLIALIVLVVAAGSIYVYPQFLQEKAVYGRILDAEDGRGVAGSTIEAEGQKVRSNDYGDYYLSGLRWDSVLKVSAEGYQHTWVSINGGEEVQLTLQPNVLSGWVTDGTSGLPLTGARVALGEQTAQTDYTGKYRLRRVVVGHRLVAEAPGYHPAEADYGGEEYLDLPLRPRVLSGTVLDAGSGLPLAGSLLTLNGLETKTDEEGKYQFRRVEPGARLVAQKTGYLPAEALYEGQTTLDLRLSPKGLSGRVQDAYTGEAIAGAQVVLGENRAETDEQGKFHLSQVEEEGLLWVEAEGYVPQELVITGTLPVEVSLQPNVVIGWVLDATTGRPLPSATVSHGRTEVSTDAEGRFRLEGVSEESELSVKAKGYLESTFLLGRRGQVKVELSPKAKPPSRTVKALYLTYYGVGHQELRGHALQLIKETEANALVIDVKGDRGWLAYQSAVPMVSQVGAQQEITIPDIEDFIAYCKRNKIYTIARIVVFKDNPLARSRPDLAIKDSRTGGLWIDGEGLAWVDPFREEVWDYNIAIAKEAAQKGFDEIQFDYIRFPTDPSQGTTTSAAVYSHPDTMENRVKAISGFLKRAQAALKPLGVAVAIDVFGYVTWREDDMGIGQVLEEIAEYVDYICPMLYPSTFEHGLPMEPGYPDAVNHPYEIVYYSLERAQQRLADLPVALRPWLQYFDDYAWATGKPYGEEEIQLQKKATYDNGLSGWMLWDPTNQYQKGGLAPES